MFNTVIWATDGSELAEGALPFALALAEQDDAELVVLHINEVTTGRSGGYPMLADEDELRAELEARVAKLRDAGVDARLELVTTLGERLPAAIAQAVEWTGADLVVIGTHARGTLGTLVHGSVTKSILSLVKCPMLAVPVGNLAPHSSDLTIAVG